MKNKTLIEKDPILSSYPVDDTQSESMPTSNISEILHTTIRSTNKIYAKADLESQINTLKQMQRLSDANTKILLAKASKFMNVSETGKITGPSFFTAMINWKLIIQILIELVCKYIDYSKTDKMLWESNKK